MVYRKLPRHGGVPYRVQAVETPWGPMEVDLDARSLTYPEVYAQGTWWKPAGGRMVRIEDMKTEHLENVVAWIRQAAPQAVLSQARAGALFSAFTEWAERMGDPYYEGRDIELIDDVEDVPVLRALLAELEFRKPGPTPEELSLERSIRNRSQEIDALWAIQERQERRLRRLRQERGA